MGSPSKIWEHCPLSSPTEHKRNTDCHPGSHACSLAPVSYTGDVGWQVKVVHATKKSCSSSTPESFHSHQTHSKEILMQNRGKKVISICTHSEQGWEKTRRIQILSLNGSYHSKNFAATNGCNEGSQSSRLSLLVVHLCIHFSLKRLTLFCACVQGRVFHPSNANNLKFCHWRLYLSLRNYNCFLGITNELKL